jgi:hypothetical protein
MKRAILSGDIIAYTTLSNENKHFLEKKIHELFAIISKKYKVYCRLIKGDTIECVVENPKYAFEIALLFKTFIKSLPIKEKNNKRFKYFKNYGIRIAIGIGKLNRYDKEKGIIDGEAIYMSGRKINEETTHNKKRIVIKNTLFFVSKNEKLNSLFQTIFSLIDFILNKATSKQCEVVFYKILNYKEKEIAKIIKVSQPVINQHSLSVGWNALEQAIRYFRQTIQK